MKGTFHPSLVEKNEKGVKEGEEKGDKGKVKGKILTSKWSWNSNMRREQSLPRDINEAGYC